MQTHRTREAARIDRSRPLAFRFNGRRYNGFQGDTLASALLANGIHLVGRSFKYHRPRGILSAGPEEPNALVQLGAGGRCDPNMRATQVELYDGLQATSQNCWPSVGLDVGAANDLLAPLFPAGFYYKTFMWPAGFWEKYEYVIRRAAGLGRIPGAADPDRYDHCHAHCDVLVVGAGPAGLSAALTAARTGARVILVDEQSEPGGALLAEATEGPHAPTIGGKPASAWVARTLDALADQPQVTLLPRTTLFGYYDDNFLCALERVTDHLGRAADPALPRQRLWKIRAGRVVLATGSIERPLIFQDNDRPGVMLAGAVRSYVNRYGVRPGDVAVLVTNNDAAYAAALDLQRVGATVEAIVDLRDRAEGPLPTAVRKAGVEVLSGYAVTGVKGGRRVRGVTVAKMNGDGVESVSRAIACDLVAVSGGWNPTLHLFSQSRGKLVFEDARGVFLPGDPVQALECAGACAGRFELAACLRDGAKAGLVAARAVGFSGRAARAPAVTEPDEQPWRVMWVVPSDRPVPRMKAFVDFQNDVTVRDLKLAVNEGFRSVEHVKRYTTLGMGTDQGKTGNVSSLGILSETLAAPVPAIGTTTFRSPYTPTTFAAIAGRHTGRFLDPVRKTPMHAWHQQNGAVFEPVGQWLRPWYFPRAGEDLDAAVRREVTAVRTSLGLMDASTLGKIDIQGRDAAELLNRVYTNAWSKLAIGRARYGLMLGEDGMVMDDGVTVRLAETRYWMSTTTGNAARVLAWLEEWVQTEWPELQVYMTSVTEQWATCSLAGPNAKRLMTLLCDDVDFDAFAHMEGRSGTVAGIPAWIFRVSFTGETSYEVNVPASYGLALWTAMMSAGARFGITPYGTEAMHVLRAEKGYIIVGQETDGTVTPLDLGMDWILSRKKPDFLGKRSLSRADIVKADRKQMVGLLTEDAREVIPEGAQIIEAEGAPPVPMLGHVSSSYFSPTLGRSIALAMVRGGHARTGERLLASTGDRHVPVTVCDPVFYDPEGKRLHG